MKTEPNMNVLLLLTQEVCATKEEKLIFLFRKPINDYSENDGVYWFWKGKAHKLTGQLSINQRLVICNDKEAESIINSIITKTPTDINGSDVIFQVPNVTRKEMQDWNGWISFFLQAIIEQAGINIAKTRKIQALYEKAKMQIPEITNSQFAINATDALFTAPILTTASFMKNSGITKASAVRIISRLREHGMIIEIRKPQGRRSARYLFKELFEIVG